MTVERAPRWGWRWVLDDGALHREGWALTRRGALAAIARLLDERMKRR